MGTVRVGATFTVAHRPNGAGNHTNVKNLRTNRRGRPMCRPVVFGPLWAKIHNERRIPGNRGGQHAGRPLQEHPLSLRHCPRGRPAWSCLLKRLVPYVRSFLWHSVWEPFHSWRTSIGPGPGSCTGIIPFCKAPFGAAAGAFCLSRKV